MSASYSARIPLLSITPLALALSTLALSGQALAKDLVVDPNGGPNLYKTVGAAVAAAAPGDRVLVRPGSYPGFRIDRSIEILGVGKNPGAVVVEGIGFHPVHPHSGYRVVLSGMTLTPSNPQLDATALGGNELGTGEILLDSMVINGGVSLSVWEQGAMEIGIDNCEIRVEKAEGGVQNAALVLEGAAVRVEMNRSEVIGGTGTLSPRAAPLAAVLITQGASLRCSQCRFVGGSGAAGQEGAAALVVGTGSVRGLQGASELRGGHGGVQAAGGPAIRADAHVPVGTVTLIGGTGTPNGAQLDGRGRLTELHEATPELEFLVDGSKVGPTRAARGSKLEWKLTSKYPAICVTTSGLSQIGNPLWPEISLDPFAPLLIVHGSTQWTLPEVPTQIVGLTLHTQALGIDPARPRFLVTSPTTIRIDG